ncbi:MAG: DUF6491 family protein [Gammaproteobacteria bacterium]|jgi:hypothetical protein
MVKFINSSRRLLMAAGLLLSTLAAAAEPATIHFANHGSIRDWQSEDKNELFVQDVHKQWYRATFWAPCFGLPFAIGIGFVTGTMDALDQFSSVIVDGERCMFRTFEKSDAPPPHEKRKKAKDAQNQSSKQPDNNAPATEQPAKLPE